MTSSKWIWDMWLAFILTGFLSALVGIIYLLGWFGVLFVAVFIVMFSFVHWGAPWPFA